MTVLMNHVQAHHGVAHAVRQMLENACEQGHAQAFVPELVGLLSTSSQSTSSIKPV